MVEESQMPLFESVKTSSKTIPRVERASSSRGRKLIPQILQAQEKRG